MIAIVTDSASMLPASLQTRYGIVVVPLTITIDGRDHAEGVDLAIGEFYERLTRGAVVTTATPSPGAFVDAYQSAASAGAEAVLSVHTGAAYSATVASATVAAELVDIPVTIVDTGVASFPVALAVWSAAEELTRGAPIEDAAAVARETARRTGSLFVVGVPEVARRGGRFVAVDGELTATTVLLLLDGRLEEYQRVIDIDAAVDVMVEGTLRIAGEQPLRVGVGHAVNHDVAALLIERLAPGPGIVDVTMYEVGPSVGAHTGAGTFGVVYAPVE
ncbi:MAG: DegV family protein [Acidimicrobiia bacterium]